jgi:SAM-dependent methyltransferase
MTDPSPGDVTLTTYQAAADLYRRQTGDEAPEVLLAFLDRAAETVGPGAFCLELGSGPGRDALLLEQRGLRVRRTDATPAFVDRLRADGYDADVLDVRVDSFGGPYDLIWADAVLLHLDRTEFAAALRAARRAVPVGAHLAITLKEGDAERWESRRLGLPRWFTYWREPELRAELAAAGWSVVALDRVPGPADRWLYALSVAVPDGD